MEIVKLTAGEILLSIFDLALPFYQASSIYRVSANKYAEERSIERSNFRARVKYLKKRGLIESFVEGKERYLEITPKGLKRIIELHDLHPTIDKPDNWDKKWRLVIFDVPEKHKTSRDMFRRKLLEMGFEQIQYSVYVHPFECSEIIKRQSQMLLIENYVLISVADIIQGEEEIIEKFVDKGILLESDLK